MKRRILLIMSIATVAAIGLCWATIDGFLYQESSLLLSQNVEALADGETPTYDCPGGWNQCVRINHGNGESTGFWKD